MGLIERKQKGYLKDLQNSAKEVVKIKGKEVLIIKRKKKK